MNKDHPEYDGSLDVYDHSEFKIVSNCCYPNCCRTNCIQFQMILGFQAKSLSVFERGEQGLLEYEKNISLNIILYILQQASNMLGKYIFDKLPGLEGLEGQGNK